MSCLSVILGSSSHIPKQSIKRDGRSWNGAMVRNPFVVTLSYSISQHPILNLRRSPFAKLHSSIQFSFLRAMTLPTLRSSSAHHPRLALLPPLRRRGFETSRRTRAVQPAKEDLSSTSAPWRLIQGGGLAEALKATPTKTKVIVSACSAFCISNMDKVNLSIAIIPMAQVRCAPPGCAPCFTPAWECSRCPHA